METPLNTDLLNELIAMKQRDADTRAELVRQGRLFDGYDAVMQQVHTENAHRLDALVTAFGWPTLEQVGLEGTRSAWLIAQHAICTPALQRRFLALMTTAATAGDVPPLQVAFLTDRVRGMEGKKLLYGTVLDWDENGELSCAIQDPCNLDARRKAVGLPPFAQDLAKCRQAAAAEGAKPPTDMAAWTRERAAWARRVGWTV
jgi:hypothetical protein